MVHRAESGEFPAGPAIRVCHGSGGAYIHVGSEGDSAESHIPSDDPVATSEDPPASIEAFHDQDWLIIVEALAAWGGNPNTLDSSEPRKARAWDLMSTIASERGFPEGNPLKQIDDSWGVREEQDR